MWPFSKKPADIQLPNEFGRSPENPAPELVRRRREAAAKTPDVPGAFRKAGEGLKILGDKGLMGKRSQSKR